MSTLHALGELVAVLPTQRDTPLDPDDVKPGWLGFGVFLAMAAATAVLLRSFVKQTRRVDFEEQPDADTDGADTDGAPADDVRDDGTSASRG